MFDPTLFGPVLGPLVAEERPNPLGPGRPDPAAQSRLRALDPAAAFTPHAIRDRAMADCCLAGVWLYYDDLDASHRISQSVNTPSGSFWHAVMHRREPDAWNSKYWWDRVGRHAVFPALCDAAKDLAAAEPARPETAFLLEQSAWNPHRFVDLCEAVRTGRSDTETLCRRIQLAEWRLLFAHCFRAATGT